MDHPAMRQERHAQAKIVLRRLLDLGPTDQRVRDKYALLDQLEAAYAAGNNKKQIEIAEKLAINAKAIQAAEAEQRAAMEAALKRARSVADPEMRVEKLVDAFEICALARIVALDDFGDDETADRAVEMKHRIVTLLDAIGEGRRAALARLLESPFAGVRAAAGIHLLNAGLMRERILPLLQEIERTVSGSAGWIAFWALSPDDHGDWLKDETETTKP
jgi:hypothetical protein